MVEKKLATELNLDERRALVALETPPLTISRQAILQTAVSLANLPR